jgi:hypothetical protein
MTIKMGKLERGPPRKPSREEAAAAVSGGSFVGTGEIVA